MTKKLDKETLEEIIRIIDKSPAMTWAGNGGAKQRIQALIDEQD